MLHDGTIGIPEGGCICLWALQNLMPVLTLKERKTAEDKNESWVWRVHLCWPRTLVRSLDRRIAAARH